MVLDEQDEYKRTYDHAVKLLSLRIHSSAELRRKLLQRKYQKDYVEQALAKLFELKVLNDEQFAEIFLDNLIRYKTYGYYGLKMKLLQRGISSVIIEKLLSENLSIDQETEIAHRLANKKSRDKDKLASTLARKGFRNEVIYKVLNSKQ